MMLGSVAIAGLPPLNGFVSEWLLYMALIRLALATTGAVSVLAMIVLGIVSFVGALAALSFVRLVGIALLGQPRSDGAARAHESGWPMVGAMAVMALACAAIGLLPGPLLGFLGPVADELQMGRGSWIMATTPVATLASLNVATWGLVVLGGLGAWSIVRRQPASADATWSCGYAQPTARMQYTARSFSETLSEHLVPAPLRPRLSMQPETDLFPEPGSFETDCQDPMTRGMYEPFLERWADRFARLRWMQQGMLHVYLVYVLVALLAGLAWSSIASWSRG
jgi:NADH:ubiquinone oxidoreductase subunit 5 (subunit L)/multisubunit Na+/H+ antiporter MnhA subunit